MVRKGLRNLIQEEIDLKIVAEASDGVEAIELASKFSPDIILMDINLPDMDGIEATRIIKAKIPEVQIIGLSLHDNEHVSIAMKKAGASSYLSKSEAFEALCTTIRREASDALG